MQLFAKKGFASTTVEDITDAADVGKGTFFNYFRTKEHILSYFAEQQVTSVTRWAHQTRDSTEPPEQRMRALLANVSQLPGNNPELVRAALGTFFANEEIRKDLRKQISFGRKTLARYLASLQKQQQIRQDIPPALLARTFQQMAFGSLLLWSLHQDAGILSYMESAFEVIWRGMTPECTSNTRRLNASRKRKEKENGKRS